MKKQTYSYKTGSIDIYETYTITTMPNNDKLHATPNHTDEDIQRAHELGYNGDVVQMTLDHDHLHLQLSEMLGFDESYALRSAITGEDSEIVGAEETAVLAIQKLLNLHRKKINKEENTNMKKYTQKFLDVLNAHNIEEKEIKTIEDRDNVILEFNDEPVTCENNTSLYIENKKAILITKNDNTKNLLIISNDVNIYE